MRLSAVVRILSARPPPDGRARRGGSAAGTGAWLLPAGAGGSLPLRDGNRECGRFARGRQGGAGGGLDLVGHRLAEEDVAGVDGELAEAFHALGDVGEVFGRQPLLEERGEDVGREE